MLLPTFSIDAANLDTVINWYGSTDKFVTFINNVVNGIVEQAGMDQKYIRYNRATIVEDYIKGQYNKLHTKYIIRQLKTL